MRSLLDVLAFVGGVAAMEIVLVMIRRRRRREATQLELPRTSRGRK